MRPRRSGLRAAVGLTLALVGVCLGVGAVLASGPERKEVEVVVHMAANMRFTLPRGQEGVKLVKGDPLTIRIQPGTKVTFLNTSPFPHNVIHATVENLEQIRGHSAFQSPEVMATNQRFSVVFREEGTYPILCYYAGHHLAGMVGTIIVGDNPPDAARTFARRR